MKSCSLTLSVRHRRFAAVILALGATALAAEPGAPIRLLEGHQGSVLSVQFSSDGRTLASSSRDKTIKLWDPASGSLRQTLTEHALDVYGVVFSPKGDLLASCSGDKTIRLWNAQTLEVVRTLEGHTDFVRAAAFSPDQKTLASVSLDRTARLWDVATGRLKRTLTGHTARVKSVVYTLGDESVTLDLKAGVKAHRGVLDRFGVASVGTGGGPVKFYLDDLQYTASKP